MLVSNIKQVLKSDMIFNNLLAHGPQKPHVVQNVLCFSRCGENIRDGEE